MDGKIPPVKKYQSERLAEGGKSSVFHLGGDRKEVVEKTFQLKAVVGGFHWYPSKYPEISSLSAGADWIIKKFG